MAKVYIEDAKGAWHEFEEGASQEHITTELAPYGGVAGAAKPAQPEQELPLGQYIEQGVRNIPSVLFGSKGADANAERRRRQHEDGPLGSWTYEAANAGERILSNAITGIPDLAGTAFNVLKHKFSPNSPVPDVPNIGTNIRGAIGTPELSPDAPLWQTIGEGAGAGMAGGGAGGSARLWPLAQRLTANVADTALGHGAQEIAKNFGAGEFGQFLASLAGGSVRSVGQPLAGGIVNKVLGGGIEGTRVYDAYKRLDPTGEPSAGSVGGPAIQQTEAALSILPGLSRPITSRIADMNATLDRGLGGVADDVRGGPFQGTGDPSIVDVGREANAAARTTADAARTQAEADMRTFRENTEMNNPDVNARPTVRTGESIVNNNRTTTTSDNVQNRLDMLRRGERVDPDIPQLDASGNLMYDASGNVVYGPSPRTYNYQLSDLWKWMSELGSTVGDMPGLKGLEHQRLYGAAKDNMRPVADAAPGNSPGSMDRAFNQYSGVFGEGGVLEGLVPIGGHSEINPRTGRIDVHTPPAEFGQTGSMIDRGMTDPSKMSTIVDNVPQQALGPTFGNWFNTVGRNPTGADFSGPAAGTKIGKIDDASLETATRTATDQPAAIQTVQDVGTVGQNMTPVKGGIKPLGALLGAMTALGGGGFALGGIPGIGAALIPLLSAAGLESGPMVRSLANRYKGLGDSVRDNAAGVASTVNTVNQYPRSQPPR